MKVKIISLIVMLLIVTFTSAQTTPVPSVECPPGFICETTKGGPIIGTMPTTVPLASEAERKLYALSLVNGISGQVYGDSVSGESRFSVPYEFQDADPDHMARVASSQVLQFTADPLEELESSLQYRSTKVVPNYDFEIFHGWKTFNLEQVKGGWAVPAKAYHIVLDVSDRIPFPIPGVVNAYIVTKDEDGKDNDYYNFDWDNRIDTEYGFISLGKDHVGHNGSLYADLEDGSLVVFDLLSGKRQQLETIPVGGLVPTIKGIRTVPVNTSEIVVDGKDEVVQASYQDDTIVSVSFLPPQVFPDGVYVVDANDYAKDPRVEWELFNPFAGQIKFEVKAGQRIFIRIDRQPRLPELPSPPYYDGGKA